MTSYTFCKAIAADCFISWVYILYLSMDLMNIKKKNFDVVFL